MAAVSKSKELYDQAIERRTVPISGTMDLTIELLLRADIDAQAPRGMLLLASYRDAQDALIPAPYQGWWRMGDDAAFVYVPVEPANAGASVQRWSWMLPIVEHALSLELSLVPWKVREKIEVAEFEILQTDRNVVTPPNAWDTFSDGAIGRRTVLTARAEELTIDLLLQAEIEEQVPRGMLLVGLYRDENAAPIDPPYPDWGTTSDGVAYVYVPVEPKSAGGVADPWSWTPPPAENARSLELGLVPWKVRDEIELARFETRRHAVTAINEVHGLKSNVSPNLRKAELDQLVNGKIFHRFADIESGKLHVFRAELTHLASGGEQGALVRVQYYDDEGQLIPAPYPGLITPPKAPPYAFLSTAPDPAGAADSVKRYIALDPPEGAAIVFVGVQRWSDQSEYKLDQGSTIEPATLETLIALVRDLVGRPRLDGQGEFVKAVLRQFHRSGQIGEELEMLRQTAGTMIADHVRLRLPKVEGIFTELDTSWLPIRPERRGAGRIVGPANRVMTLVKVCVPYENSGGAVRNMNTGRVLKTLGWDPYAVTPIGYPGRSTESGDTPDATDVAGVPHLHLSVPKQNLGSARLDHVLEYETAQLAAIYRRYGGRLIHAVSGYRGYESALKALALRAEFGVPVLYDFRSFHEHTWGQQGRWSLDAPLTKLRAAQEDRCVREANRTVVISEAMKALLIERGGSAGRISVVPNGVDVDRFAHTSPREVAELGAELNIADGARVHGYVSNISAREGHSVLLRAHAQLVALHPDLVCLIVGEGPLRERIEREAGELGIAKSVRITGEVPHDRIHLYYRLFDVFVVPRIRDYASDYVTPIKPFEAMAAGRPVVMSDLPVTHEILGRDGERGLIADPGSPESLAAAIARLLDNRSLAAEIAERGRSWVERERGWDKVLAGYDEIYRALGGEPEGQH